MVDLLKDIIEIIVGGITEMASGIGSGVSALAEGIFVTSSVVEGVTKYSLTTFGGLVCVFAGIALAVGLGRFVLTWVRTLGN